MPTINFTSRWLDTVSVDRRTDFFDALGRGRTLGLRVAPSGRKTWFLLYRYRGQQTRLTLGVYPILSLKEARRKAESQLGEVARGHDPARHNRELRQACTFDELATLYLEGYAKKHKRTWKRDEELIKRDLSPRLGKLKIHGIARADIRKILRGIVDRGAPIMANRVLEVARKMFNWAIEEETVDPPLTVNPCWGIKAPSAKSERQRVLKPAELRDIWKAYDAHIITQNMADAFRLMLLTGQRESEVLSMRWADIDLDDQGLGKWWTIPEAAAKNRLTHRVPLSGPAEAILQARMATKKKDSPWVFPSRSKKIGHLAKVHAAHYAVLEFIGIDDIVIHDFRRTAASMMASLGVPRLVIAKILNHKDRGITRIYDRYGYDQEKREALALWAEHLMRIINDDKTVVTLHAAM